MLKVTAEKIFKHEVDYKRLSLTDRRLAWNDFTEHLYQSDEITERQLYNWSQPKFLEKGQ